MDIFQHRVEILLQRLSERPQGLIGVSITLVMVLLSFAVFCGLNVVAGSSDLILFVPAIIIASLVFGWGCGLLAVLGSVLVDGLWLYWNEGSAHPAALAAFVVVGCGLVFLGDALRGKLLRLDEARKENALLLDEMSHRIKNKFAMIVSVIGLQLKSSPLEARPALEAVARRVHALAALHSHLQGSRHRGLVNMQDYLLDLCNSLRDSVGHLRKVSLSVTSDPMMLPPREATSVGLIVNELVMNCYKYAFPENRQGNVSVRLSTDNASAVISVADNGIGCTESASGGMGTRLVSLLATQLNGTSERKVTECGCIVTVTFPLTADMLLHEPAHRPFGDNICSLVA
ncbi:Two-component sensor histidine kinase, contains HisKA and HATPase domains [Filomicrobium insigne]|uniref:histidine kinase n=1 Tax=Filomicrobium insigne TaxID=418854 RepID=A0A1H0JNE9_9HYPH|nr:histidine kinase dimerization/phosphoacceptor domain -containing protein [Filomicrobium insigne]SDO45325.1 Two-component sensor histidine kinase, contains HisKA and HATPase domains [Filomicrobium insigne]